MEDAERPGRWKLAGCSGQETPGFLRPGDSGGAASGAAGDEAEQQASRGDDARGEMAASPLFGGERRGEGGAEEI